MKIDYELVEKIGATHYANGCYYKADGVLLCWSDGHWSNSTSSVHFMLEQLKPIPPKPQVSTEYEKVMDSIFDSRADLEAGNLYFAVNGDTSNMRVIKTELHLIQLSKSQLEDTDRSYVYRKVEKEIDWRDKVTEFLANTVSETGYCDINFNYQNNSISDNNFLEMCRVALRANGEL